MVLGYGLYNYIKGVFDFALEYPWGRRHLWAAMLVVQVYLISDLYCWLTLGTEMWITRHTVDEIVVLEERAGKNL